MRNLIRAMLLVAAFAFGCTAPGGDGLNPGSEPDAGVAPTPDAGAGPAPQPEPQREPDPRAGLFEEFVDAYVAGRTSPDAAGIAVSIVGPRGVVFEKAYGMAHIGRSIPVALDTPFELASLSKQFTAMAILILYEDGMVDLDAALTDVFPEAPAAWADITVHHVLSHQSGIPNMNDIIGSVRHLDWSNEEVLDWAMAEPLRFPPGTRYEYTNTGYVVLALLVDRLSGQTFESFVVDRILAPLHMTSSGVTEYPPDIPVRAVSYISGTVLFEVPTRKTGEASQYSSIADLKLWEAELRDVTLVSRETLDLAFTPHIPSWPNCSYGYGWVVCGNGESTRHEHAGSKQGFRTSIVRIPEETLAIIMVSNGSYEWAYDLGLFLLLDLYLANPLPEQSAP